MVLIYTLDTLIPLYFEDGSEKEVSSICSSTIICIRDPELLSKDMSL